MKEKLKKRARELAQDFCEAPVYYTIEWLSLGVIVAGSLLMIYDLIFNIILGRYV